MKVYKNSFRVKAPLEKVTAFYSDTRALKILTPPPVIVQLKRVETLAEDSTAEFVMWMGPVPVYWIAKHSEVNPMEGFTDTQIKGPFSHWQHKHSFHSIDEHTTEVKDVIEARFSRHPYWAVICRLMWVSLPTLFAYRGWKTKQELEV
jgi:ligand-binding SRPBCC domain-containing protein